MLILLGRGWHLIRMQATEIEIFGFLFGWDFFLSFFSLFFLFFSFFFNMPSCKTNFQRGNNIQLIFWPVSMSVTVTTWSVLKILPSEKVRMIKIYTNMLLKNVKVWCCESNLVLYFYLLICLNYLVSGIMMNNWRGLAVKNWMKEYAWKKKLLVW